ncbi:protein MOR1-like [Arachis ipaensis]|uniref:protein MOR1-like n=1 Tax=Arachis ipaensis TaxID=130454 RepID=UPI000A2B8F79|nr:protein MOR1-like [Arachis ipaensis]
MVFIHESAAGSGRKRSVASLSSSAPDASLAVAVKIRFLGILADILKSLGDNKKHMRECALNTLDLWLAAVHLDKMVPYITIALMDSKLGAEGRKDLFDWLSRQLSVQSSFAKAAQLLKPASTAMTIIQELVEHYSAKGWLQRVEQCVLHMDISSLDFNQVVTLCREHGLYSALVYLFNKGLNDYRAPLEELFEVLQNSQKDSAVALGFVSASNR